MIVPPVAVALDVPPVSVCPPVNVPAVGAMYRAKAPVTAWSFLRRTPVALDVDSVIVSPSAKVPEMEEMPNFTHG